MNVYRMDVTTRKVLSNKFFQASTSTKSGASIALPRSLQLSTGKGKPRVYFGTAADTIIGGFDVMSKAYERCQKTHGFGQVG